MLTTARKAGDYRAVAGAVKSLLVDLELNGDVSSELDERMIRRITTVQEMLAVAEFAPHHGELDTYGSSPDKLDLAQELAGYVTALPGNDAADFNVRTWSDRALRVLHDVKNGATWETLADHHDYVVDQLVPLLCTIASLPPEEPDW